MIRLSNVSLVQGARMWVSDNISDLTPSPNSQGQIYIDADICLINNNDIPNEYKLYIYKETQNAWSLYYDPSAILLSFKATIPFANAQTLFSVPILTIPASSVDNVISVITDTIVIKKLGSATAYDYAPQNLKLVYSDVIGNVPANSALIAIAISDPSLFNYTNKTLQIASSQNSEFIFSNTPPYQDGMGLWLYADLSDATQGDGDVIIEFLYKIIDIS